MNLLHKGSDFMKAILMAGGQGTRLRPLTCNIPKPMMPIMEKPVMQYTLELLRDNGIKDIGVTLQYLPDEIINYFGDGKEFGVNLQYFIEETPLGTAGSVKNAESFLNDTFIVISGDALTDFDLNKAMSFHRTKGAIATLLLKEVQVPLEYGVVVTDKNGRVTGFLEKPSWSEVFSDKANTGIYVLEPEIFDFYEKNQKMDFSNDLFPILLKNNMPIYGYVAEGYWCDIGNVEQFIKCHYDILEGIVKVNIKGNESTKGVWIGENCTVSSTANIIPPVFIGDNTKIYEGAEIGPYSCIGKGNIISARTNLKRSILFDNCYVGNDSEVRGSVLCNKVQVGKSVAIFEEVAIGDETHIGQRSIVKPGVKIWPSKIVGDSSVVQGNIIWGGRFSRSLFGKSGINGEVNVDITPELVSKLGSAYGSLLKPDSKVAISCSDDGAAQMFKYSLATGLLSIGIEVYDFKRMTTAMTRMATVFFGVQGSIHVALDKEDSQKVNLIFMDKDGLNIDKAQQRKVENSFVREDFRRIKTDTFKKLIHLNDCTEYYIRQIVNQLNINAIRKQKYKIVLSTRNNIIKSVVTKILEELNVELKLYDFTKDLVGLRKEVVEGSVNMGIYISDEASHAVFVDETGNILKDEMYEALKALILLNATKIKTIVAPANASDSVEQVAKMYNAKFIRTKISERNVIDEYIKNEKDISRNDILNAYLSTLDAVNILSLTLNLMAERNIELSQFVSSIPRYFMKKLDVSCPWDKKGVVMRNLIEELPANSVDLIEGVRLRFQDSWALVLPDSEEPLCKVYTESVDENEAKKLMDELTGNIQKIINI